jgi:predicted branched-subunit amino acid permease
MSDIKHVIKRPFFNGLKDGIPIGLGYFAVSFSIGITAKSIGMNAFQGFLLSLLNNASAGEVAGVSAISDGVTYFTAAIIILVTNARYILMSCAMSQKFSPDTPLIHRFLIGFDLTDELFGIAVAYPGYIKPSYMYGAFTVALPMWALGTMCGIIVGNILPEVVTTALSVAIYGMFLAVVIPPCRKNKAVTAVVLSSFVISGLSKVVPVISDMSESVRVIVLTLVISVAAALLFPVKDEEGEAAQ